ncbi:MAG: DUF819 family protein [Acidobacteriota bacterium]|nr:DUF819 family protein [Acidobacteriota bacterium]
MQEAAPLFTNDAIVLGILMGLLAAVFYTSSSKHPGWQKFYSIIPALLLCYFLPSVFSTLGIISGDESNLYFVASRYLLPTSLVLLTLSIDLPAVLRLGPKAVIMFFTGTAGILFGGPLAILITSWINPDIVGGSGPDAVWRGMTTVAGSWIGGGANQTAMKEVFEVGDDLFSAMIAVDVIVANIWMAVLLFCAGRAKQIDHFTGADASAIDDVQRRVEEYQAQVRKIPTLAETMVLLAVGFGVTALGHFGAQLIVPMMERLGESVPFIQRASLTSSFFWIVVIATTAGLILSFTKARRLEGVGASRVGSVFLYVLIASIGMKMDITAVFENPGFFLVGAIWMSIHAGLMLVVAYVIKAPVFFMAVGSQANVGGAASAPVVASAFHPSLAPVGVLLAVFGYALGTYAAWACGLLMQAVAGGG